MQTTSSGFNLDRYKKETLENPHETVLFAKFFKDKWTDWLQIKEGYSGHMGKVKKTLSTYLINHGSDRERTLVKVRLGILVHHVIMISRLNCN